MIKELKATAVVETLILSGQYSYNTASWLVSLPPFSSSCQPITHTAPQLAATQNQFLIPPCGFQWPESLVPPASFPTMPHANSILQLQRWSHRAHITFLVWVSFVSNWHTLAQQSRTNLNVIHLQRCFSQLLQGEFTVPTLVLTQPTHTSFGNNLSLYFPASTLLVISPSKTGTTQYLFFLSPMRTTDHKTATAQFHTTIKYGVNVMLLQTFGHRTTTPGARVSQHQIPSICSILQEQESDAMKIRLMLQMKKKKKGKRYICAQWRHWGGQPSMPPSLLCTTSSCCTPRSRVGPM